LQIASSQRDAMLRLQHHITTVVVSKRMETDKIAVYELADPDNWQLPPFAPGAHINLYLPNGFVRPYSLCGVSASNRRYWIAVQREDSGRGGSMAVHQYLTLGTVVPVSLPKNDFSLSPVASQHMLIAGGIGITPILAMAEELANRGQAFSLHYAARSPRAMAFLDHIQSSFWRDRAHFYVSSEGTPLDLQSLLASRPIGEHVYCCGPTRLINDVLGVTAGWDPGAVHIERFGGGSTAPHGRHFTVTLSGSRREVQVVPGETIVEALRREGVDIPTSCEAGVCSTCKVRYLAGSPDHRDLVLSHEQRQQYMLPCVSGSLGDSLILDL
jgi:vanillate O-demethylase ferredoxin subunit